MDNLRLLPNIGAELEKILKSIGVRSPEDLKKMGSRDAFQRILNKDNSACLNKLYALEGAIQGVRWYDLPLTDKRELKNFFNCCKSLVEKKA